MKVRHLAIIVPVLAGAACSGSSNSNVGTLPANSANQRLSLTSLVADAVTSTAGTGAAGFFSTGAAGTGGTTGAAGATTGTVATIDPNLVNGWGLAMNPAGPIWVAANGSGLAVAYDSSGQIRPIVVTVPPAAGGTPPSSPTGLVFNSTTGFGGDVVIVATEDGVIAGWQTGTEAVTRADNSATNTIYKGLTLATQNGVSRIYATDFHNRKVDAWDSSYAALSLGFTDPGIPTNYGPFGIQVFGTSIYVTYAFQDQAGKDDDPGNERGYVDIYDFDGNFVQRLISREGLNSPWGLAMAPSDFGTMSGTLLVANFGDGHLNAFDVTTGSLLGTAQDTAGNQLKIDGLWSIMFGNDTAGAAHNQLFFTAGPNMENDGAFGRLDIAP